MASPGTVYLLRNGDSDVYKIGRTRTTAKRRRGGLSTGNPERLTTVKEWAVPARHGEFEQLLHCTFADRRLRSGDSTEFFDFAGVPVHELVAQIDREHASFAERLRLDALADAPQRSDELIEPTDHIAELVQRRHRLRSRIKLLQAECAGVDAQLKAAIQGAAGVRHDARDRPLVTWRTVTTRRFDAHRFQAEHPALHAAYLSETTSRPFKVHD